MKRIGLKGITLAVVAFLALSLNSCKKEPITPPSNTDQTTMDANVALQRFDATYQQSMEIVYALLNNGNSFKTSGILACADVVIDTTNLPYRATINYGSGCVDDEGVFRSGVIQMEFNEMESMRNPGAYMNATFTNAVSDDITVNGTFTFNNNGLNAGNNLEFALGFALAFQDASTGDNTSINGNTVYEFVGGQNTESDEDDYLALTGQLTVNVDPSTEITVSVEEDLIRSRATGCDQNYIDGVAKIVQNGQSDRFIDYGDGTCDDQAVETVDGNSTTITLDGGFN